MPKSYRLRSDAEWAELICECKSSGQTDYQWCKEHRIPTSSFYRHLKKYHECCVDEQPKVSMPEHSLITAQQVVPLQVMDDTPELSSISRKPSASLPAARLQVNGMTIELFDHADPLFIRGILDAVSSLC